MPKYLIFKIRGRGKNQQSKIIGVTPVVRSVRGAWAYYKRNFKRSLDKKWAYHIMPINHGRFWEHNGKKWEIHSWYGNHKSNKQIIPRTK